MGAGVLGGGYREEREVEEVFSVLADGEGWLALFKFMHS